MNRDMAILDPTHKKSDVEELDRKYRQQPRLRYTAMRARMEASAHALACGASNKMAAEYAGVSERQIKKYLEDPDFRARIAELRELLSGKIQGKILREFNRRVSGKHIRMMDTMDLSRIYDRVTQGGKGMAINIAGDVNVNKYDTVLAALFDADPEPDGEDFPSFGDSGTVIPGTSTPVER